MSQPAKGGRNPLPPHELKDQTLRIRMTRAERDVLDPMVRAKLAEMRGKEHENTNGER